MIYIRNTMEFKVDEPSAITLGKFDGLHRGHVLLMDSLKEKSSQNKLKSIVFTFDIPPNKLKGKDNLLITTNEEKKYIFEENGVDYLIECPFNETLMHMMPEAFIEWIVKSLNIKYIIVGNDFRFGYKRAGDFNTLIQYADKYGYQVIVHNKMQEDNRDISSTFVREEIVKGNIRKANHLLGYEFFIRGQVVHGRKLGRTIGIPTINMNVPKEKILPPLGVYVSRVMIDDNWYMGVTNIGCKPTITGVNPIGAETYIIDFCQNIYDKVVTVQLLDFIRPEMKFDSIDDLKSQMNNDISKAKKNYDKGLY